MGRPIVVAGVNLVQPEKGLHDVLGAAGGITVKIQVTATKAFVVQEKKERRLDKLLKAAEKTIATLKVKIVEMKQELDSYRYVKGRSRSVHWKRKMESCAAAIRYISPSLKRTVLRAADRTAVKRQFKRHFRGCERYCNTYPKQRLEICTVAWYNGEKLTACFALGGKHTLEDTVMLINFNEKDERKMPVMNGGTGEMTAKMHMSEDGKIIPCKIHAGGSIGIHKHTTSDDINYILSGVGKATCDGKEENLVAGTCHICKKGSEHSIINTGTEDLVMLTVVVER